MSENYNEKYNKEEEEGFNIQAILSMFLFHWKWFVASVIVCLAIAFVYLRSATPVYNVTAKIMVKDKKKGGYTSEMMALEEFGLLGASGGIDNELEVLQSKSLVKDVVIDMKLYTTYVEKGKLSKRDVYRNTPVWVDVEPGTIEDLVYGYFIEMKIDKDSVYHIVCNTYDAEQEEKVELEFETATLPYLMDTPNGKLIVSRNVSVPLTPNQTLLISVTPPLKMAKRYLANMTFEPTSKMTSVAVISLKEVNRKRGEEFLTRLVEVYNDDANEDKNQIARKTEEFIGERIILVGQDLDNTERQLQGFKEKSGLVNLTIDAQKALEEGATYEKKLVDISTQLRLVEMLHDAVFNPSNSFDVLPATASIGLTDPTLTAAISQYNTQVLERKRLLQTASPNNPTVMSLTTVVEGLLENVKTAVSNLQKALTISKRDIEREASRFNSRIGSAPSQERQMVGIERQREIKSELYLMLLQKREENSIALAATADNAKIIDDAVADEFPVSPKRSMIWLVALVMGVGIPFGIIYLLDLLNYKITSRADVDKLTKVPVLGEVSRAKTLEKGERALVVREDSNNLMAETFRAIRTNLNFILNDPTKKVVLFTSTTSGEGKTFISSNLAMSLALLGKKVILCGLDIRKPRLVDLFKLTDKKHGITTYLAGDADDKELLFSQILKSGVNDNLDLLPAGIIPPNPAELLAKENLDKAIELLSEEYDYILLDTAPVGLVADTLLIGRVANASVYVCRAGYTAKSSFDFINEIKSENKLPNMSLIINDIDIENGTYYGAGKYGYGKRYGYGYRQYGYGVYGVEEENSKGKRKK